MKRFMNRFRDWLWRYDDDTVAFLFTGVILGAAAIAGTVAWWLT